MSGKFISNKQTAGGEFSACRLFLNERLIKVNLKECAAEIKRQNIGTVADKYLTPARKSGYICPNCNNGTGDSGTGATIYPNSQNNRDELKCFVCGENWNCLTLIATCEHLNLADKKDLNAAVKIGCDIFGLSLDKNYSTSAQKTHAEIPPTVAVKTNETSTDELPLIHADISDAQNNLSAFLDTTGGKFRGLTFETLKNFGRGGYLSEWISPKSRLEFKQGKREKLPPTSRRFIIPTANHYVAVMLDNDRTSENKIYWKMHAGKKEIFGADFLPVNADFIIVTEGEIDAMSIWQAKHGKFNVIAMGGVTEYKNAAKFLQNKFSNLKPHILILFDSDETGRKQALKMSEELLNIGFPAVCKFLSDENSKLDANDILQNEGDEKLAQIIDRIVADAQKDFSAAELEIVRLAENSAQSDSLDIELQEINRKIADFDNEKSAAIEKLKSAISFDKDFCFSDEIVTAAAFAKIFDKKIYSDFKASIQNQIAERKGEKFIVEWQGEVKGKVADVQSRHADLLAQRNSIKAKITSSIFFNQHDALKNFVEPDGYSISENGIEKIVGDKSLTVSRVPAFIKGKLENDEDKTIKYKLAYLAENGTWKTLPATGAEIIFNSRKLIDSAAYGFPVTSGNANLLVDFLDAFKAENEKRLPLSLNVSRCGWRKFGGNDYFVDPRRNCEISDENGERKKKIIVDSANTFALSLKSVGSIDEWRKAYEIAKKAPIARLIVAASVAAPLLYVCDSERNFISYFYGTTRGGKSTCLLLGASAVGNSDMVISFDGTNNGLLARAAETNDYPFFVDEKQSADKKLQEQFQRFIYSVANGRERQRANKDGTLKNVREWRNITICNGETKLLDDNATGGAHTRLLQIPTPKEILSSDDCREIRRIIKGNHGLIFPLFIDKIFKFGFDNLRENYNYLAEILAETFPNLLDDYRRYMAIMTLADVVLNIALGVDDEKAMSDAVDNAKIIFDFVPTLEEIADAPREIDFVTDFIAQNQKYFLDATPATIEQLSCVFGKFDKDFVYISVAALNQACDKAGFDYQKLVADLIDAKFFIPDDKILKDRKKPSQSVSTKINKVSTRCFRIPTNKILVNDN